MENLKIKIFNVFNKDVNQKIKNFYCKGFYFFLEGWGDYRELVGLLNFYNFCYKGYIGIF